MLKAGSYKKLLTLFSCKSEYKYTSHDKISYSKPFFIERPILKVASTSIRKVFKLSVSNFSTLFFILLLIAL